MATVASRDLRNHTADVLRRVSEGAQITVTVHGEPVAELKPVRAHRPESMSKHDLMERLVPADPGLRRDLETLAGDTTDDLGPIR